MFLRKQSHAIQGKMSHSKSISTQSFPTQQAYSPGLASGYPGWNEAPVLLRSISPSAGCKAWRLLGHQVESPLPILIRCRDWSNVTGSLAKIPINISCKDREVKLYYKDGKQGPWSLLGELHINIALRNGHHYTLSRALGLYRTSGWSKAWCYRTFKTRMRHLTHHLHTLLLVKGNPEPNPFSQKWDTQLSK